MCDLDFTSLEKHIISIRKKDKTGKIISNRGGWQSKVFEKINKYNKPVFKILDKAISEVRQKIDFKKNLKLHGYWYNINGKCAFNVPHTHVAFKTIVSGVLYIKIPKNSGKIIFNRNDPVCGMMYDFGNINNYNEYNSSNFTVLPKEGLFVLFPSSLTHYVEPNLNDQERIVISFNYGYEL